MMRTGRMEGTGSAGAGVSGKIGPRAKCDQVVYEAIAKAAEIIVRSRCDIPRKSTPIKSNKPSSSSRFNLEVEEVDQVRAILQRWRRSLHVPLRLDVFFQNEDQSQHEPRKELLERWCIDYVASSADHAPYGHGGGDDTIAQLRQVCKRVVILLRSLHCLTRMMPAYRLHRRLTEGSSQSSSNNGAYYAQEFNMTPADFPNGRILFSFYVSGDENDSASLSSATCPFSRQTLSEVPTPYGKLKITGHYDSSVTLERLLNQIPSVPIPIPKNNGNEDNRMIDVNHTQHQQEENDTPPVKSLPNRNSLGAMQVQRLSYSPKPPKTVSDFSIIPDYTLRPSSLVSHNSNSPIFGSTPPHRQKPVVRRAFSALTDNEIEKKEAEGQHKLGEGGKALSGLSLALMNEEHRVEERKEINQHMDRNEGGNQIPPVHRNKSVDEAALRRALHHPPPNFQPTTEDSQQQPASASPRRYMNNNSHAGDYGYGYNNWHQRSGSAAIRISPNDPQSGDDTGSAGLSQAPLGNTPPTPMFIGSSSPHIPHRIGVPFSSSKHASTKISPNDMIMSPPFQNPTTLQAPTSDSGVQTNLSRLRHPGYSSSNVISPTELPPVKGNDGVLLPPLTSLDLLQLHMSPFKAATVEHGSMLSSLSMANMGAAAVGPEDTPFAGSSFGSTNASGFGGLSALHRQVPGSDLLLRSSGGGGMLQGRQGSGSSFSIGLHTMDRDSHEPSTSFDDMPFVVDNFTGLSSGGGFDGFDETARNTNNSLHHSSSVMGTSTSSVAVASFAHKCATASRLRLFSSSNIPESTSPKKQQQIDTDLSTLTDQLAEFRNFGASFTVDDTARPTAATAPGVVESSTRSTTSVS
mmetsp:Transcript_28753/g.52563  ORF Transcript_28753/g.52563 Transcript_28753/m.52563 type:complete len:858 (-) Transcript_28753:65-2638(-)